MTTVSHRLGFYRQFLTSINCYYWCQSSVLTFRQTK